LKRYEEHPHFLTFQRAAEPIPHIQFKSRDGRLLIPDFILKPIVAVERDSNWEVLDLKRPQVRLLSGPVRRLQLSHEVHKAIRQLRDYGDYFHNAENTEKVEQVLGHRVRRPRLAVLIGRLPKKPQLEALEAEQERVPDVRIVTYDEILEHQLVLIR
jgi:hypothetical protein